jgi:serine/threonine protein kinase
MEYLIGKSLGRYHILEQLGEGGMAVVYKAFDTRLEREVAIKVVRRKAFPEEKIERILKRFEQEAKALAKLNHANIIPIIDSGEEDGTPYLVMGYIPGGTLKEQLRGKPIPWQEAAQLLAPIARALAYSHKKGIVHRDIKPSNILITEENELMLTDFGIARVLQSEETVDLTGTGMGVGTPEYMAPEQGLGHKVDHRADIYALGIVLYEMVTGRKPFRADTPMAVVIKQINDPLPRPTQFTPKLPKEVEQILLKALAKDPANRYQNMGEVATALEELTVRNVRQTKPKRREKNIKVALQKTPKSIHEPKRSKALWFILGGVALASILLGWVLRGGSATAFPTMTPTLTFTPTKINTSVSTTTPTLAKDEKATAISQSNLYDDFDKTIGNNMIDNSLWNIYQDHAESCIFSQDQGYLEINHLSSSSSSYSGCFLNKTFNTQHIGNSLEAWEMKVKVESDFKGNCCGEVGFTFSSDAFSDGWLACAFHPDPTRNVAVFNLVRNGTIEEYRSTMDTTFDEWHSLRLAVDHDKFEISCYLDDYLVGSFVPKDEAILRNAEFSQYIQIGWPSNTTGTYYIDDVQIYP